MMLIIHRGFMKLIDTYMSIIDRMIILSINSCSMTFDTYEIMHYKTRQIYIHVCHCLSYLGFVMVNIDILYSFIARFKLDQ